MCAEYNDIVVWCAFNTALSVSALWQAAIKRFDLDNFVPLLLRTWRCVERAESSTDAREHECVVVPAWDARLPDALMRMSYATSVVYFRRR